MTLPLRRLRNSLTGGAVAALVLAGLTMRSGPAPSAAPPPVRSERGLVIASHPLAAQAGLDVLAAGGTAVDATVAAVLVEAVARPDACGLGGGGVALVRLDDGVVKALDFRERAPLSATPSMFEGRDGSVDEAAARRGPRAVAVPGAAAGLVELHRAHGTRPFASLVAPAARLAAEGVPVDPSLHRALVRARSTLRSSPSARALLFREGRPLSAGDILVQPDLAASLQRLQKDPLDWSTGRSARLLVDELRRSGGLVTVADLRSYQPAWRTPVCARYRGAEVCGPPPPSAAGVSVAQVLKLIEPLAVGDLGLRHVDVLHWEIEALKTSFAERARSLGDPAFGGADPSALLTVAHVKALSDRIPPDRARPAASLLDGAPREEPDGTAFVIVVDAQRRAVAWVWSLSGRFGSGVLVPGTGVFLNAAMDGFELSARSARAHKPWPNAIGPAKVPLTSLGPVLVEVGPTSGRRLRAVVASTGGAAAISIEAQLVSGIVDFDLDASELLAAPRLHHQLFPDVVRLERHGFDPATREALQRRGHHLEERGPFGEAGVVLVDDKGALSGAVDPRGHGGVGRL